MVATKRPTAKYVLEAQLREISAVMARAAADLTEAFRPFIVALIQAKPQIGEAIYLARKKSDMSRERYAALHNIPLQTLIRVERWRLIRNDGDRVSKGNDSAAEATRNRKEGNEHATSN